MTPSLDIAARTPVVLTSIPCCLSLAIRSGCSKLLPSERGLDHAHAAFAPHKRKL